jgi:acid phosphatase family membrane protein YuiD
VKSDVIINAGNDIQFNIISFSAIIGGFLFTGISILVSIIDKERIKRLWEHNYLDNLYRSASVGIFANITSIIAALTLVLCITCGLISKILIIAEIFCIILSLVEFSWCATKLFSVLRKLKNDQ